MRKNSSGFVHFFLLLAIALVTFTGIGYFAYKNGEIKTPPSKTPTSFSNSTSTDNKTENWKTYRNHEYSFEFKYPPNWGLGAKCDGDSEIDLIARLGEHLLNFPYSDCGTANIPSTVMVFVVPELPNFYNNYRIVEQKTVVHGKVNIYFTKALNIDHSRGGFNKILQFYTQIGENKETRNNFLVAKTGSYEIDDQEFYQILSTFEFTN